MLYPFFIKIEFAEQLWEVQNLQVLIAQPFLWFYEL